MNAQYLMAYGLETFYSYIVCQSKSYNVMTSSLNKILSVFAILD